jgi:NADH-quinone oxidoreductase subunit J
MEAAFYLAGAVAVAATVMVVTRLDVVHALLYLVVSLLAIAVAFFVLGAPFVAALEVIIYAGAIVVLFVFVVMMLALGQPARVLERRLLDPAVWAGPSVLCAILVGELVGLFSRASTSARSLVAVSPAEVGLALYGPYVIGVELAAMLLLGALVGAYHLGWRGREGQK